MGQVRAGQMAVRELLVASPAHQLLEQVVGAVAHILDQLDQAARAVAVLEQQARMELPER